MSSVPDDIAAALSLHGEAFMRMFEGSDDDQADPPTSTSRNPISPAGVHGAQSKEGRKESGGVTAGKKIKRKRHSGSAAADTHGEGLIQPQHIMPESSAKGASIKHKNEIDEVFHEKKSKKKKLAALGIANAAVGKHGVGQGAGISDRQGSHMEASTSGTRNKNAGLQHMGPQISRRNFFSDKVWKVHTTPEIAAAAPPMDDSADAYSDEMMKAEFAKLQHEVELFGGSLLGKKDKKKWKVNYLSRLGVKTKAGVKTAASIGLGRAVKAAQVKVREEEEAVRAGIKLSKRQQADLKKKNKRTGSGAQGKSKTGIKRKE